MQDKQLTVWLGRQRPVFIGCRFFKNVRLCRLPRHSRPLPATMRMAAVLWQTLLSAACSVTQTELMFIGTSMQGVVDLAWAPDGLTLLATSTDGTIAALQFTTDDLAPLASKKVSWRFSRCHACDAPVQLSAPHESGPHATCARWTTAAHRFCGVITCPMTWR